MKFILQTFNGWKPSTIFRESSILDIWQAFEYIYEFIERIHH